MNAPHRTRKFARSRQLCIVAAAIVCCAVPVASALGQHLHGNASATSGRVGKVKPGPRVLANESRLPNTVEVTITAEPTQLTLVPGKTTGVYSYNGHVPGPTLEVHEGDHVIIHFHNKLSEPTTIHWHGMHIPVTSDGSPFNMVDPGKSFDYDFTVHKGTAGTYWYHPHPGHSTGLQIAKGLYGALIVRAAVDPIPSSYPERVLILSDNSFHDDGSIDMALAGSQQARMDEENGREGNVLLVNGQLMPEITIRAGEIQRWRVVNSSAARIFKLSVPGQTMLHVGDDGGLFEHPVEVSDIVIANSERVELLVRGTGKPGEKVVVKTLPYNRYMQQTRPEDWNTPRALFTLRYTDHKPITPVPVPAVLRAIPAIDTTLATRTRVFVLQQGFINGKLHDMDRIDETAKLGDVEIWQIENIVGMDHPFHLHGFQFQIIERDGVPVPYRSWKDTVNLPKHSTARFVVRFSDFAGLWMYHCHILDHEDHGMMGILEVK